MASSIEMPPNIQPQFLNEKQCATSSSLYPYSKSFLDVKDLNENGELDLVVLSPDMDLSPICIRNLGGQSFCLKEISVSSPLYKVKSAPLGLRIEKDSQVKVILTRADKDSPVESEILHLQLTSDASNNQQLKIKINIESERIPDNEREKPERLDEKPSTLVIEDQPEKISGESTGDVTTMPEEPSDDIVEKSKISAGSEIAELKTAQEKKPKKLDTQREDKADGITAVEPDTKKTARISEALKTEKQATKKEKYVKQEEKKKEEDIFEDLLSPEQDIDENVLVFEESDLIEDPRIKDENQKPAKTVPLKREEKKEPGKLESNQRKEEKAIGSGDKSKKKKLKPVKASKDTTVPNLPIIRKRKKIPMTSSPVSTHSPSPAYRDGNGVFKTMLQAMVLTIAVFALLFVGWEVIKNVYTETNELSKESIIGEIDVYMKLIEKYEDVRARSLGDLNMTALDDVMVDPQLTYMNHTITSLIRKRLYWSMYIHNVNFLNVITINEVENNFKIKALVDEEAYCYTDEDREVTSYNTRGKGQEVVYKLVKKKDKWFIAEVNRNIDIQKEVEKAGY